jgi:hypothetical protein
VLTDSRTIDDGAARIHGMTGGSMAASSEIATAATRPRRCGGGRVISGDTQTDPISSQRRAAVTVPESR